jgi:hypothetical protein
MATPMTEAKLRERLQARPDSLAFSRLADLYRKSGNITQAIELCVRGVEKHPDYTTGRIILGRCYLEQENLDKAVEAFVGVCSIDERNIVAIKMLADIFIRQGFHEKAGDLFLLLAGIDPYNDILARSAAQTRGSGKRTIRDILGIAVERQRDVAEAVPPSIPRAEDAVPAPAGTQIVTPQELGITTPATPPATTVDSKAATELATDIDIDEVLAEATEITGSDITERMTDMFEADKATAAQTVPETSPAPEPVPEPETKTAGETPVEETIEVEPLTEVPDGNTITARIDELFGKDTIKMPAIKEVSREPAPETMAEELAPPGEAAFEETMIMDADVMKLKDESGISIKPEEPAAGSKEELAVDELVTDGMVESIENAAGNLIVDEQDSVEDLFKGVEEPEDKAPGVILSEEKEPVVADLIVSQEADSGFDAGDTISGDDVQRRIEQMLENKSPEPVEAPLSIDEETSAPSDSTDLAAEKTEEPSVADLVVSRETDSGFDTGDTISGDDVQRRIEQLLENKVPERAGAPLSIDAETSASSDSTDLAAEKTEGPAVADLIVSRETDSGFNADDTISGDDVTRRIEQMLENKVPERAGAPLGIDAETSAPSDSFEPAAEKTEGIAEPTDDLEAAVMELVTDDADSTGTSTVSPVSGSTVTADDVAILSEETFESKGDKEEKPVAVPDSARGAAMDETSASSKLAAGEDSISGDDVVERLEVIFEEKEEKEDTLAKPEVSLGHPGLAGVDSDSEATVVFEHDEKSAIRRTGPPVDQETLDEAFFEIKAPAAAEDETSESSKPGAPADSITGDDVAKRLEGMFQKKDEPVTFEPPPTAAESTGTATEAIDDTALSSDSVIETVGILTGNDVEDRLNDMFKEAESVKDRAEQPPASLEKRQSIEKEEAFEPVAETIEEFEETLVSGDNEPLVPGAATKETVPASPVDRAEAVDDESSALGELEEILDAHPLESLETETAKTHPETIETGGEQTAVFEDFTPGSVPKAPPPAPDVPIFLTSKDTPMDSETILAEVGKNDSPYDLPDHVLTPTLADLYFQQGQPHLALSIYRRLLEKSGGENDKFKKRIGEIEKAVADGTALNRFPEEQAAVPVVKPKKITPAVPRATSHTKKSFGVSGEKLRPLSGVRLKKRPKIQWRKKAGEK